MTHIDALPTEILELIFQEIFDSHSSPKAYVSPTPLGQKIALLPAIVRLVHIKSVSETWEHVINNQIFFWEGEKITLDRCA